MRKTQSIVSISIAIVEDDVPAREILAGWIRSANGFKLLGEYSDAETAIAELKPRLPETQFLMVTVYEDANHIFDALAVGASGYLLKQTRRSELLDALRDVHVGGSPMSSQIARKVVQSFRRQETENSGGESVELSQREHEVLELLARGYLYKEIAEQLKISVQTVNTYIRRIYEKLHVRSRAQAVAKYAHLPMGTTH